MPPRQSPTRRVLGEKDANASLNITSPTKGQWTNSNTRSTTNAQGRSKVLSVAVDTVPSSPRIGQKRRITEVEGVEAQDWDDNVKAPKAVGRSSDTESESDQVYPSMVSTNSAADTTVTSFAVGGSQESVVEQQFELPEPEMSQRTLDKIHAVTLPQNTSQPNQFGDRPTLVQNASQDSVGMSNFLNFQSDASSQVSDGLEMIDVSITQVETKEKEGDIGTRADKELSEGEKRKAFIHDKAERLKTLLQLAKFKVETRQTNTPSSRLKIPESHRLASSSPPSLPLSTNPSSRMFSHSTLAPPVRPTGYSPEARIAALRAQATMQRKPAVRSLQSLPIPQIKPTAFSARWADQTPSTHAHSRLEPPSGLPRVELQDDQSILAPNSPPASNKSLHIHEDETATGVRPDSHSSIEVGTASTQPRLESPIELSNTNEQLSSPPPSEGEEEAGESAGSDAEKNVASKSEEHASLIEKRLTSSIVKGEAASGLLQLMRGGHVDSSNMQGPLCGR